MSEENNGKKIIEEIIEKEVKVSIRYGIIGSGGCGGFLAQEFAKMGYKSCVINTAIEDLNALNMDIDSKCAIGMTSGAGKNLNKGAEAVKIDSEKIRSLMEDIFNDEIDHIIIAVGLGGGSGTGSLDQLIAIAKDYANSVRHCDKKITIMCTLPVANEGGQVLENAELGLDIIKKHQKNGNVCSIILIDGTRLNELYKRKYSMLNFRYATNKEIVEMFCKFNELSTEISPINKSCDPEDYKSIINSDGCLLYGRMRLNDFTKTSALGEAITNNLKKSILARQFDLEKSGLAAAFIVGSTDSLDEIPASHDDFAFGTLKRLTGNKVLHSGVYIDDNIKGIEVYTIVGKLPMPDKLLPNN